jgi:flagellar hook-associated protein 3 FlgL
LTFSRAAADQPILYSVTGVAAGAVATGTYKSGEAIVFNGITLEVEGDVESGDSYQINRSGRQSVFETVQGIADSLLGEIDTSSGSAKLVNDLTQSLGSIDNAMEHLQSRRTIVGNRLQSLDTRIEKNADERLRLETQISDIQDLDFAKAVSELNLQSVALQAAQQAYIKIQGLSLFNFLR